jgi:hypothetical protein
MTADRILVWSYGGGVQSVAIAVLVASGKLPCPDLAAIADTSREGTATWQYLSKYVLPLLSGIGLQIEIAPHSLATVDLYAHNGDLLLPMYTASSKFPTFCSSEWKEYVMMRWARQQGVKSCDVWLGFSHDEIRRAKPGRKKWFRRKFPLIDLMISRATCWQIIQDAGLPIPAKSACWCCPHRNNSEWRYLRDEQPDDWAKAIGLEELVRKQDSEIWLHRDRVLLPDVDIDSGNFQDVGQCSLGYCFV